MTLMNVLLTLGGPLSPSCQGASAFSSSLCAKHPALPWPCLSDISPEIINKLSSSFVKQNKTKPRRLRFTAWQRWLLFHGLVYTLPYRCHLLGNSVPLTWNSALPPKCICSEALTAFYGENHVIEELQRGAHCRSRITEASGTTSCDECDARPLSIRTLSSLLKCTSSGPKPTQNIRASGAGIQAPTVLVICNHQSVLLLPYTLLPSSSLMNCEVQESLQ